MLSDMKRPLHVSYADLIRRAGGVRQVANALGISTQAVYDWRGEIPDLRLYQLHFLRPEWFKEKKQ